jgi:hypothetical protein
MQIFISEDTVLDIGRAWEILDNITKLNDSSNETDIIVCESQLFIFLDKILEFFDDEYKNGEIRYLDEWKGFFELLSLTYYNLALSEIKLEDFQSAVGNALRAAQIMPRKESYEYLQACDNLYKHAMYSNKTEDGSGVLFTTMNLADDYYNRPMELSEYIEKTLSFYKD